MKIVIFVLALLIAIPALAKYKVKDIVWQRYYENVKHGELLDDDPIVLQSIDKCSRISFPEGVEINGVVVRNGGEIMRHYNRYRGKWAKNAAKNLTANRTLEQALEVVDSQINDVPEYVRIAHRQKLNWKTCFYKEEGFTPLYGKMPIHKNTGERLRFDPKTNRFIKR